MNKKTLEALWDQTRQKYGVYLRVLIHHRGQLYVYVRASGGAPPFLWSFGENAPEFAPRA